MLLLSVSYGFFTKITFKAYGSVYHSDDRILLSVAKIAFIFSAASRFFWPTLMDFIGFKKTYGIILAL